MYGVFKGFDLSNTSTTAFLILVCTCAKIRVRVSFPDASHMSSNNRFFLKNVAASTTMEYNSALPKQSYFDFSSSDLLSMSYNSSLNKYENLVYVYESKTTPQIYLYTHLDNFSDSQECKTNRTIHKRNYLYDIDILVFKSSTKAKSDQNYNTNYTFKSTISIFDPYENKIMVYN